MGILGRWLSRLRGRPVAAGESPEVEVPVDDGARPPSPPPPHPPFDPRLARLTELAPVSAAERASEREAVALLRALRITALEPLALAVLSKAATTITLGEELATAAAKACVDRGELGEARRFLRATSGPDALLLASDLAEETGDAPSALALVERVLARSLDHPGARERHTRLALALGRRAPPAAPSGTSDTTVLSAHVDSPYVMRRELARGGAAAVYEAEDRELQRRVALKVYHDPLSGRDQLLHEARVATALTGPGIIRVFDVDVRGGWLVLEYLERGSLREWLRARSPNDGLQWLPSLLATLIDVHARGYAHLDVKPGNVLLRTDSESILADFGSARRLGEPSPPGSLGYVSPERLAGAPASTQDDAYGVGRILQEVISADPTQEGRRLALAARLTGPAAERPTLSDVLDELRT